MSKAVRRNKNEISSGGIFFIINQIAEHKSRENVDRRSDLAIEPTNVITSDNYTILSSRRSDLKSRTSDGKEEKMRTEKISLLLMDVIIAGNYTRSNILRGIFCFVPFLPLPGNISRKLISSVQERKVETMFLARVSSIHCQVRCMKPMNSRTKVVEFLSTEKLKTTSLSP